MNSLILQQTYLATLYLAAAISLALAIYAWLHRDRQGSLLFSFMMLAVAEYSLTAGLMSGAPTTEQAVSWVHFHYFGLTTMVALFISFILQFTGNSRWLNRYTLPIIILMPAVTQIIIETNASHQCFLKEIEFSQSGILMGLSTIIYGDCFFVHTVYSYSLIVLGLVLLVLMSIRSFWVYKAQSVTLLIAVMLPILGSVHDSKVFVRGLPYPVVPVCFAIMGVLLAWNLYRNRMLNIVPVARDMLIESMSDGMFVLDMNNYIVDINSAAVQLFGLKKTDIIGKTAEQVLHPWPQTYKRFSGSNEAQGEISVVHNGKQYFFDIKVSPVINRFARMIGKMVVLRDITNRVNAQIDLQESLNRVNQLKEELYKHSIRDPLTGMYNRRYLEEIFPREIANAVRSGSPLCFVMMDIDHFKTINDTYGHSAGDQVLLALSGFFKEHIRVGDLIFRYGGEEFLALLINSDLMAAKQIAERWQNKLAKQTIHINNEPVKITISIGIAEFGNGKISDQEVIQAADMALYQSKANGRNQISIYSPQLKRMKKRESN